MKRILFAVIAVVFAALLSITVSSLIPQFYGALPVLPDFFFTIIPEIPGMPYIVDGTVVLGAIFVAYLVLLKKRDLPELLLATAFMWISRAFLMFVTPLGDPSGDVEVYGFLEPVVSYGMFPSGHTGFLSCIFFWSFNKNSKVENSIIISLIAILAIGLLSSRGHYTIDIVGGLALAYLAVNWSKAFYKRFMPSI